MLNEYVGAVVELIGRGKGGNDQYGRGQRGDGGRDLAASGLRTPGHDD